MVFVKLHFDPDKFTKDFRILLSSYTRAINKKEGRAGSLFQQNTKAKCLITDSLSSQKESYPLRCFYYIHQNPLRSGLTDRLEDWEFSSYRDYTGLRNGTLINREFAVELLNLPLDRNEFMEISYSLVPDSIIEKIR